MDKHREIITKGDLIIFNKGLLKPFITTRYDEELKKNYSIMERCKWVPDDNEVFIIKKTSEERTKVNGIYHYELWVHVYSEKGPWTNRAFPANLISWIFQRENGEVKRKIFISEVFNSDLFIAKGEEANWNWLSYQNNIK